MIYASMVEPEERCPDGRACKLCPNPDAPLVLYWRDLSGATVWTYWTCYVCHAALRSPDAHLPVCPNTEAVAAARR